MRQLIKWICHLYCAFVVLWFLSNLFIQDVATPLVVLDKFAWFFLIAAIPVFVLSLFSRSWLSMVISVAPLLIAGYFYAALILPSGYASSPKPDASAIRIGTFNLWNHNQDYEAISHLVQNIHVDVLAIQELTEAQKQDVVVRLSKTHPYYFVSEPTYGGTTALFSKLNLLNIEALDFGIDRPAILADVEFDEQIITVVSAHLNPSYWAYANQPLRKIPSRFHQYIKDQNAQASMIIEAVQQREYSQASVLACDCNTQETASTNKLLRSYFNEALRTMGRRWFLEPENKFMNFEQNLRHIDYIWFEGDVQLSGVYRAKHSAGSDHQPIVAEFWMR